MSNITNLNRDYLIKINVKEATIDVPKMTFWNTDKKTSNMFVQLVINMSENELIKNYVTIENATDYKIVLNVIKPKTNQYRTFEAKLLNEEKALFEIDLTSEFIDQVGNYNFEFEVSSKVDNNDESITTSSSTYEVKGSILTNLNQEISSSPDLPILKQLIEQVKSLEGGDLTGYQKKEDETLETTSKKVVGAINEINSQLEDVANLSLGIGRDGLLYIKKQDGTLIGTGVKVSSDTDLSKVTLSVNGNTLILLNNGTQIASVDLPSSMSATDVSNLIKKGVSETNYNALDTTDKRIIGAINELNTQLKSIANLSLTIGTDGLLYIKKQDGTLMGTGVNVSSSGTDLSKITMSLNSNTLILSNNGSQIASVDLYKIVKRGVTENTYDTLGTTNKTIIGAINEICNNCLLYTSPSPRDA